MANGELPFAVEGIIGAGKSTLVRTIGRELGLGVTLEDVAGNPFLADFYKALAGNESYKTALIDTQIWLLERRTQQLENSFTQYNNRFVIDRTLQGDLAFYAQLYAGGFISKPQFETLKTHLERRLNYLFNEGLLPKTVIWLEITPENAYKRMKQRSRDIEAKVEVDYLQGLKSQYEGYVLPLIAESASLIFIDWNRPLEYYEHGSQSYLFRLPQELKEKLTSQVRAYQ